MGGSTATVIRGRRAASHNDGCPDPAVPLSIRSIVLPVDPAVRVAELFG
jgi:hypothetical protein